MLELTVVSGGNSGQVGRFGDAVVSLGRDRRNDFVLLDGHVSSRHGEILRQPHGYVYRDLRSRHGTIVTDGERMFSLMNRHEPQTCLLHHGSRITIGQTVIDVSIPSQIPEETGFFGLDVDTNEMAVPDIDALPGLQPVEEPSAPPGALRGSLDGYPLPPIHATIRTMPDRGLPVDNAATGMIGVELSDDVGSVDFDELETGTFEATPPRLHPAQVVEPPTDFVTTRLGIARDVLHRTFARNEERLPALMRLCGALTGCRTLPSVLEHLARACFEIFPLGLCVYTGVADKKRGLTPLLVRFADGAARCETGAVFSSSLLERVLETREPLLFQRDRDYGPLEDGFLAGPIASGMYTPLFGTDHLLGVLAVGSSNTGRPFGTQDLELLSLIASIVAATVERTGRFGAWRDIAESLARMVAAAVEAREPGRRGHSERVVAHGQALARAAHRQDSGPLEGLRFGDDSLRRLRLAGLLHDFGRIALREDALERARRLPVGGLERIRERFAQLKLWGQLGLHERLLETLRGAGRAPTERDRAALARDVETQNARLDGVLAFVEKLDASPTITPGQRKKLAKVAKARVLLAGEATPLLESQEVARLQADGFYTPEERAEREAYPARSLQWLQPLPWPEALKSLPRLAVAAHGQIRDPDEEMRVLAVAQRYASHWQRLRDTAAARAALQAEAEAGELSGPLVELFLGEVLEEEGEG